MQKINNNNNNNTHVAFVLSFPEGLLLFHTCIKNMVFFQDGLENTVNGDRLKWSDDLKNTTHDSKKVTNP